MTVIFNCPAKKKIKKSEALSEKSAKDFFWVSEASIMNKWSFSYRKVNGLKLGVVQYLVTQATQLF